MFVMLINCARYGENWQLTNDLSCFYKKEPEKTNLQKLSILLHDISSTTQEAPVEIVKKENWQLLGTKEISAYNPVEGQTDGDPCIGARNIDVCKKLESGENVCATRIVPQGSVLKIGELMKCTVYDTTSTKYADRVDVLFPANMVNEALDFGVKNLPVYILK